MWQTFFPRSVYDARWNSLRPAISILERKEQDTTTCVTCKSLLQLERFKIMTRHCSLEASTQSDVIKIFW